MSRNVNPRIIIILSLFSLTAGRELQDVGKRKG